MHVHEARNAKAMSHCVNGQHVVIIISHQTFWYLQDPSSGTVNAIDDAKDYDVWRSIGKIHSKTVNEDGSCTISKSGSNGNICDWRGSAGMDCQMHVIAVSMLKKKICTKISACKEQQSSMGACRRDIRLGSSCMKLSQPASSWYKLV